MVNPTTIVGKVSEPAGTILSSESLVTRTGPNMKPARLSGEKLRKAMAENQEFVARTLLGVAELDAGRRLKVDLDD